MDQEREVAKSSVFIFRIAPKERRLVDRAAKLDRRTTSDFIRLAAIDKAMELIEQDKKRKEVS